MPVILAVFLLLAQDRPFTARVTMEEAVAGGDSVKLRAGRIVVKPGEALTADLDGHRIVLRRDLRTERRRGGKAVPLPAGLHPLDFWVLTPRQLSARFEVAREEVAGDRSLPEDDNAAEAVRARPNVRSLAVAEEGTSRLAGFRLIPRDAGLESVVVRAWREASTDRLVRLEIVTATRRTICTVEEVADVDVLDDRWFDPDNGLPKGLGR